MRKYELKPFKLESDPDRYYDILRSVLINEKLQNLPHGGANLVSKRIQRAKQDTSAINNLKEDFPVINHESVELLANRFDVKFIFYWQHNSRSDLKLLTSIGSGAKLIHLKIKCLEDIEQISFSKLEFLRELDVPPEPCNLLKSKIKKFYSFLDAFRHRNLMNLSEETFFQEWGSFEVKFGQIRAFAKLFKVSFALWSDEKEPTLIRSAYVDEKIDILISKDIIRNQKISIYDEFMLVLDSSILKKFVCKICEKTFKRKYDRNEHEKVCQNGTKYSYKEKIYGQNQTSLGAKLISKNCISASDSCDTNFVSFDIESVNTPITSSFGGKTVVRNIQEVIILKS